MDYKSIPGTGGISLHCHHHHLASAGCVFLFLQTYAMLLGPLFRTAAQIHFTLFLLDDGGTNRRVKRVLLFFPTMNLVSRLLWVLADRLGKPRCQSGLPENVGLC